MKIGDLVQYIDGTLGIILDEDESVITEFPYLVYMSDDEAIDWYRPEVLEAVDEDRCRIPPVSV